MIRTYRTSLNTGLLSHFPKRMAATNRLQPFYSWMHGGVLTSSIIYDGFKERVPKLAAGDYHGIIINSQVRFTPRES